VRDIRLSVSRVSLECLQGIQQSFSKVYYCLDLLLKSPRFSSILNPTSHFLKNSGKSFAEDTTRNSFSEFLFFLAMFYASFPRSNFYLFLVCFMWCNLAKSSVRLCTTKVSNIVRWTIVYGLGLVYHLVYDCTV